MIRIVALNEDENVGQEIENVDASTKEAQETIVESEYLRALKLRNEGKLTVAIALFEELLKAKILNEAVDSKISKSSLICYSCHKNIARIYEEYEQFNNALCHYISAFQIDDTDICTINRFGQLSLKLKLLNLAEFAFRLCMKRNSMHISAIDGLLQTQKLNYNVLEICSLTIMQIQKYSCPIAKKDLCRIISQFKYLCPLFEKFWGISFNDLFKKSDMNHMKSFFDYEDKLENSLETTKIDLSCFILNKLNWISVGQYINEIYNYLCEFNRNFLCPLKYEDLIAKECCFIINENSPQNIPTAINDCQTATTNTVDSLKSLDKDSCSYAFSQKEVNNENSDSVFKPDEIDAQKPKQRRRCSDLLHLEQWSWHKSRQKKKKQECSEIDSNLNRILRKIYSKFMLSSFEEIWTLKSAATMTSNSMSEVDFECNTCKHKCSINDFDWKTRLEFNLFLETLKKDSFDLFFLLYNWLKYTSFLWNHQFPEKLKSMYINIYNLFAKHFDSHSWNLLSKNAFKSNYNITLLYLELQLFKFYENKNCIIPSSWKENFNKLKYMSGYAFVAFNSKFYDYKIRLAYIEYLSFYIDDHLNEAFHSLNNVIDIMKTQPEEMVLHLPNLRNGCISKESISKTQTKLEREIALKKIPTLFANNQWSQIKPIICNNILNKTIDFGSENELDNFKAQLEILLQSLWNNQDYKDCCVWSEIFLHFATTEYMTKAKQFVHQKYWSELIDFIFSYIEALVLYKGYSILKYLDEKQDRLVQNIIRLLSFLFDETICKNTISLDQFCLKRPWIVLHQIIIREEICFPKSVNLKDDCVNDENIPHSFLILFTAHEFLGKHQCCMKDKGDFLCYVIDFVSLNLRAPLYDSYRDSILEYTEQVTYCLYGYPPKKARSRHLEEHDADSVDLDWPKSIQLFDLYRPEYLPEFNSYKVESISADMEQLLIKTLALMPNEVKPNEEVNKLYKFISGEINIQSDDDYKSKLPFKISSIYYLLADFYFKSRDFSKAIKYYMFDLAGSLDRFDSWAGMALSKASKIETKLNDVLCLDFKSILLDCEETIRCFERCISINCSQTLLWIEYGSFAYNIHSFCSRYLKHVWKKELKELSLLVENRKETMLNIAFNCFSMAFALLNSTNAVVDGQSHEEKWLCQYMMGKISEKRKEDPKTYLNFYLTAANFLYENNATYPIKINHSNPTTLSVEALEIFYRTNSAIIKYLEQNKEINRDTGELFQTVLKSLSKSPFAFNKAKIDGNSLNALKRKIPEKTTKILENQPNVKFRKSLKTKLRRQKSRKIENNLNNEMNLLIRQNVNERFFWESQEFPDHPTTFLTSGTSSSTNTGSSLSDSETSISDDTSQESQSKSKTSKTLHFTNLEIEQIYKSIVQNLEECISRFPEHYKSIYRLVYHFMNASENLSDLNRCEQLLLGQYKTILGNQVNGLFHDRRNSNIFNGIWRIPSPEVDRPGSFSAHLGKCVNILIQLLFKNENYKLLIDIGFQLYKTPDPDKRYINDDERFELSNLSIAYGSQIIRCIAEKYSQKKSDNQVLSLLIDIYIIYKKSSKYFNEKEDIFAQLLVDVYKSFIKDKVLILSPHVNFLELATKLCVQEIGFRKNIDKSNNGQLLVNSNPEDFISNKTDNSYSSIVTPLCNAKLLENNELLNAKNTQGNVDTCLSIAKEHFSDFTNNASSVPKDIPIIDILKSPSRILKLYYNDFLQTSSKNQQYDSSKQIYLESTYFDKFQNAPSLKNAEDKTNPICMPSDESKLGNYIKTSNIEINLNQTAEPFQKLENPNTNINVFNNYFNSWKNSAELKFKSMETASFESKLHYENKMCKNESADISSVFEPTVQSLMSSNIPQFPLSPNLNLKLLENVQCDRSSIKTKISKNNFTTQTYANIGTEILKNLDDSRILQTKNYTSGSQLNNEKNVMTQKSKTQDDCVDMLSVSGRSYETHQSSTIPLQEYLTKTLQQKLREYQPASQTNERTETNTDTDKQSVDVIILD